MLCYATNLKVKPDFTLNILLSIVHEWLTSPYKDNGHPNKNCFHSLPEVLEEGKVYQEENKSVVYNNYPVRKVYSIHYVFHDTRLDSNFIIDLLYQYGKERKLHLQFSNEIFQDSYFISNVNLPGVFRKIMVPEYLSNDSSLIIDGKAHYLHTKAYKGLLKNQFRLPLIIMKSSNKHYPLSPVTLSRDLLGIGHVICIYNEESTNEIEILYPDHTTFKKEMDLKEVCEMVRAYGITHFYTRQFSYYGLLHEKRLHESKVLIQSQKDEQGIYSELIQDTNQEIENLKAIRDELYKLKEEKKKEQDSYLMSNQSDKAMLTINDYDHIEEYKAFLFSTLRTVGMETTDKMSFSRWRRKDVVQSILKRNEDKK